MKNPKSQTTLVTLDQLREILGVPTGTLMNWVYSQRFAPNLRQVAAVEALRNGRQRVMYDLAKVRQWLAGRGIAYGRAASLICKIDQFLAGSSSLIDS